MITGKEFPLKEFEKNKKAEDRVSFVEGWYAREKWSSDFHSNKDIAAIVKEHSEKLDTMLDRIRMEKEILEKEYPEYRHYFHAGGDAWGNCRCLVAHAYHLMAELARRAHAGEIKKAEQLDLF